MNRREFGERRELGSVRAAIRVYGDRILEGNSSLKKPHMDNSEVSYLNTRELHKAKRDIGRYKETRDEANSAKAQAETDLRDAKSTARDLSALLRESGSKTWAHKLETDSFGGPEKDETYERVVRELESVKQELSVLRLEMGLVLEERARAGERLEAAQEKIGSCSSSAEDIRRQIEESNGEQVLVELARIEALREWGEIEAERAKEAVRISHSIDQTRRKIKDAEDEIERSQELEPKLASALAEIDLVKHELRQARSRDESLSLESLSEQLEGARREQASAKEEGFSCMASMDVIRSELKRAKAEAARLAESERSKESAMKILNSKLMRAKAKLGSVSSAEERACAIVTNLSFTLEKLKTEALEAQRERDAISQEASKLKEEIRATESEIESSEEELAAAMRELEEAKASEDSVLEKLKATIESTIRTRGDVLKHSSSITISTFEYEYLRGRAVGAEDLAEKKVSAAKAWIEAVRANEREIAMKIDFVLRDMREMRIEEEREAFKMERTFSAKRSVERELQNWRPKREKHSGLAEHEGFKLGMHKRSVRDSNSNNNNSANANFRNTATQSRRAKFRVSGSPSGAKFRVSGSPGGARNSFPIKKKKQVLPNLAKLFKGSKQEKSVV